MIEKLISGGQTGADRAGFDAAFKLGIAIGGWVPKGRLAEDGIVPERYTGLTESESAEYAIRTRLNVRDSDATLIFTFGHPQGGTALTGDIAVELAKPVLIVDCAALVRSAAVALISSWLLQTKPRVLNVAGPRISDEPRIADAVYLILMDVLPGIPPEEGAL